MPKTSEHEGAFSQQGSGIGVLSHLLVADAAGVEAVAASDEPSLTWDGFFCRGLDCVKLAILWALVESGSPDDKIEQRLAWIKTIPEGDRGPRVDGPWLPGIHNIK